MKRRTRQASKERRRDRLAQAEADHEARADWLAAIHGVRRDLEWLVADTDDGRMARAAVLRADEVPDGVTDTMLREACLRALAAMPAEDLA